jgi:hypothetical protein
MFRHRTCAILRELKFLMKYVYANVMGVEDSESGC